MGVTDGDRYRFLASRPDLTEVNFWRPGGGRRFRVLAVGEPFFFKTHAPHNRVVGGGFYSGFASLTLSEAWEFYGHANGAETLAQMRRCIGQYRRQPIGLDEDPEIGCLFLRDVTFFEPGYEAQAPPEFASITKIGGSSTMLRLALMPSPCPGDAHARRARVG